MPPWIFLAVLIAVAGCAVPPVPPAVLGPLNAEPWVSTQNPPALYTSAPDRAMFQTPNSLPLGAWN